MIINILKYRIFKLNSKKVIFLLLIILSISTRIIANDLKKDSINNIAEKLKIRAKKYDRNKEIYNAIEFYKQYLKYKSKDIKLTYRLANLCFETRDYSIANQYYDSAIKINPKKFPLSYYFKGIVCMNLGNYDDAIESFTKFRKQYKKNDKNNYRKLSALYIENAEWAKLHQDINGNITINRLGNNINHADIDFSPFPVDDQTIIYGALYSDSAKHIGPVRQIFKAIKINGHWKSMGLIGGEINNPEYNTGNAVISDDGQRMYFTRSRKNWQNVDICEIFVSKFDSDRWMTAEKLPYPVNDENYTSTQPAIGQNLKTGDDVLYFVSNRPKGKGGLDIWYTEYNHRTNTYKKPHDLDKNINSIGDECCPFYDISTRTIYFSSNGRNGLGGFDIYKANGSTIKWIETTPLPIPINSSYDDYYFSILGNQKEGYFTSNRPESLTTGNGSCCDDIYSYKYNDCARIHSWGTVKNSVNYDFYNHLNEKYHIKLVYPENNIVLSDVPVELYLQGNNDDDEIFISKTRTNKFGNYSFELERNKHYKVLVKNYGYFEKKVPVNTIGSDCSDTVAIGSTLISYLPKADVSVNIYYDYDKWKLSDSAKQTIDTTLMPLFDLFPNAIIEIGSHTDSTGTDLYNIILSQKRSESVVNYLISKGIPSERLVAKGYGMRFPIAPNTKPDGSDDPAGRQLNRRTEIKIVGEINNFNIDE
jgi:outer membrane protein OmpA-like peptidoglycan-associated protein/tetratricopeptide (TPR) repeat protein